MSVTPLPTLETERLILRPPQLADFERWADFSADPVATRFLGGVQPRSVAWRAMMTMAGAWSLAGFAMFVLARSAAGQYRSAPAGWPQNAGGYYSAYPVSGNGQAYYVARPGMPAESRT